MPTNRIFPNLFPHARHHVIFFLVSENQPTPRKNHDVPETTVPTPHYTSWLANSPSKLTFPCHQASQSATANRKKPACFNWGRWKPPPSSCRPPNSANPPSPSARTGLNWRRSWREEYQRIAQLMVLVPVVCRSHHSTARHDEMDHHAGIFSMI